MQKTTEKEKMWKMKERERERDSTFDAMKEREKILESAKIQ